MTAEFIFRLFLAGVLGALIGLDREYRAKEAGYRTHFLVSLGSALLMIVSQYGFEAILGHANVNMTRRYAKVLDSSIMRDMEVVAENMAL